MEQYDVILSRPARKELDNVPEPYRRRITQCIDGLKINPRPHGVQKMSGLENHYRIRVGEYRIIYTIQDRKLVVVVVRVGQRKDVYRGSF